MTCDATRHGTYVAYQHNGCRCPEAREDWRLYGKRRREGRAPVRRAPAAETIERIRQLHAAGRSYERIARDLGWKDGSSVRNVLGQTWVSPALAERVRELWEFCAPALHAGPVDAMSEARFLLGAGVPSEEAARRVGRSESHLRNAFGLRRGRKHTLSTGQVNDVIKHANRALVARYVARGMSEAEMAQLVFDSTRIRDIEKIRRIRAEIAA